MDPFDLREWSGYAEAGGDLIVPAVIDHIAVDSRRIYTSQTLFAALPGKRTDGHLFVTDAAKAGAHFALVNREWVPPEGLKGLTPLRVRQPLKALQEIAGTYRSKLGCTVVAISGSYGKTMLKDLLHSMLSNKMHTSASPGSFNSQLGVPLSLLTVRKTDCVALIEAAVSQPGEMEVLAKIIRPDALIVTNVGSKHASTLGGEDAAAKEMSRLASCVPDKSWVLAPNHSAIAPYLKNIHAKTFAWDSEENSLPHAFLDYSENRTPRCFRITYPNGLSFNGTIGGGHSYFLDLVNMAIKAAWLLGCSTEDINTVLENYKPEPSRTELWESSQGALVINNAYSSDPLSVDKSLEHFSFSHPEGKKIVVFGGMRCAAGHAELEYSRAGKTIAQAAPDLIYLVGGGPYRLLVEEVTRHSPMTKLEMAPNLTSSLKSLKKTIKRHDTLIIVSPQKVFLDTVTETLHGSIATSLCSINLAAIETNIRTLRQKLPAKTRLMATVKANAYGTHDALVAKFLARQGIDILGVSYVDEGIALKKAGAPQDIFVLNAAPFEVAKAVEWGLEIGVSEPAIIHALALEAEKQNTIIKVHLHVDTGMSRFGCRPQEALTLAQRIQGLPFLSLDGIMTHFASADNPAHDAFTHEQARLFDSVIANILKHGINLPWRHAANSSGVMRFNFPQYNMARIGLALFGLGAAEPHALKPAVSLTSKVVGINRCRKGDTVSYGRRYTVAKEEQTLAVIPVGYYDGFHRSYGVSGSVLIRGKRAPIAGSICMDYLMADVTEIPEACMGEEVLLFGEDTYGNYLSPDEVATRSNTIVYELITCLGPRIQRVFLHDENPGAC